MNDTLLGWHRIPNPDFRFSEARWGYLVMKQTRGKRQRYKLYEVSVNIGLDHTRIARDLNRADAEGLLKVLLSCASND